MGKALRNYVCNLIAGKGIIEKLYCAVFRACEIRGEKNGQYCFNIFLKGIGCKTYNGGQLVELYRLAQCTTVQQVANQVVGDRPTIDQAVLLLLIALIPIKRLYQAHTKAIYMRSSVRIFCFQFANPFYEVAGINQRCILFNARELIDLFCLCNQRQKVIFKPKLLWPLLFSSTFNNVNETNNMNGINLTSEIGEIQGIDWFNRTVQSDEETEDPDPFDEIPQ